MKGKILNYKQDKGFGFIVGENNKQYFFHISKVENAFELEVGKMVIFDTATTSKGENAINIHIEKQQKQAPKSQTKTINKNVNVNIKKETYHKQQKKSPYVFIFGERYDIHDIEAIHYDYECSYCDCHQDYCDCDDDDDFVGYAQVEFKDGSWSDEEYVSESEYYRVQKLISSRL